MARAQSSGGYGDEMISGCLGVLGEALWQFESGFSSEHFLRSFPTTRLVTLNLFQIGPQEDQFPVVMVLFNHLYFLMYTIFRSIHGTEIKKMFQPNFPVFWPIYAGFLQAKLKHQNK